MAQSTTELVTKYSAMAAGVYREIIDATSEAQTTQSNNVVVVGQFENGPIMRPVYCKDANVARTIFGNRNTKLEAKGNFGMLMAQHVLEQGPVWILNLKNVDAQAETLQVKQLAVNNAEQDALVDEKIATVFDTNKFWKIDPMYGVYGDSPVISFASVGSGKVTVVVEKYQSSDYNYTIAETKKYNETFSNDAVDDSAFVSDFLIRVHVFNADLANAKLSVSNAFVNGNFNLAAIEDVKADKNAKYFATYIGAVGDIIDINGNNLNIATKINADTNASGLYMALNRDAMAINGIDLIGAGALEFTGDALPTAKQISRLGYTFTPKLTELCMYISKLNPNVAYMFGSANVQVGDVIANEDRYVRVVGKQYIANTYQLPADAVLGSVQYPIQPSGQPFAKNASGALVYPATSPKAGQPIEVNEAGNVVWYYSDFTEVPGAWRAPLTIADADVASTIKISYNLNGIENTVEQIAAASTPEGIQAAVVSCLDLIAAESNIVFEATVDASNIVSIQTAGTPKGLSQFAIMNMYVDDNSFAIEKIDDISTIASNVLGVLSAPVTVADNSVTFMETTSEIDMTAVESAYGIETAVYQIAFDEAIESKLTSGFSIEPALADSEWGKSQIEQINGASIEMIPYCFVKLDKWYSTATTCKAYAIQGIVSLEKHYVNGTPARQNAILDRLTESWATTSFSDPTIFRCRYMVDTFKTYIEPNAKYQYAKLADAAARFLVFIPAPFYHELRTSKNPDFHDLLGNLDMSYVAAGSNPDKPSTNSFYYARSGNTGRYIYPVMNVIYNDGFSDKVVPATGVVGKMFYSKLTGTNKVYDIVAGMDWPISAAGIVGPEFESGPADRAAMEKIGTNVIQVVEGILQLRSSKTAYQTVISAFNYPETMEKCFFVSDNVESTLNGKLFKYNNADARLAVKTKADSVCDIMVADGVIADYENKCDLDNNPVEVRKAGIIVLDTTLYNEYGISIAIHRTTVKDPEA